MFDFNGVYCEEPLKPYFDSKFITKLSQRNAAGQAEPDPGLKIKFLQGHTDLLSTRINEGDRALATYILAEGQKRLFLLDRGLTHKEYEKKLKDKTLLSRYLDKLNNTDIPLKIVRLDDWNVPTNISAAAPELETMAKNMAKWLLAKAANWMGDLFIVLNDIQQRALNLKKINLILGPPGSGKTVVLKKMLRAVCKNHDALLGAETKNQNEMNHIYLSPQSRLAREIKSDFKKELSENPWLEIFDYESFARKIDPNLQQLKPEQKRGIQHFIWWCETENITVGQYLRPLKKKSEDPDYACKAVYREWRVLTGHDTKKQYLNSPLHHSVCKNDVESRKKIFKLYQRYCEKTLIGSYIPKDEEARVQPYSSGARRRAELSGIEMGYDLSFYDLSPALQKTTNIHTLYLDEIQNLPRAFIKSLLACSFGIQASGDANQALYDPLSNLEFIRQSFRKNGVAFVEHPFTLSYRNSKKIIDLLNLLLELLDRHCARNGDDKTAKYLMQCDSTTPTGDVFYEPMPVLEKEIAIGLDEKTTAETSEKKYRKMSEDSSYMVVIPDITYLPMASKYFNPDNILTLEDIGGLESEHVIAINLFEKLASMLPELLQASEESAKLSKSFRSKDKQDITGQEMILEFHRILVGLSRAKESCTLFFNEKETHMIQYFKSKPTLNIQQALPATMPQNVPIQSSSLPAEEKSAREIGNRLGWIKRVNTLIQLAFDHKLAYNKTGENRVLTMAKNIFINNKLNLDDIELPDNYLLPKGYECFQPPKVQKPSQSPETELKQDISPASIYTRLLLKPADFNAENIKLLLDKEYSILIMILFDIKEDTKNISLWKYIFQDQARTLTFLTNLIKNDIYKDNFVTILKTKFTPEKTILSLHYYSLLCLSRLWIKLYPTLNEIVKDLIHFATSIPFIALTNEKERKTNDELYYAIAQRQFQHQYLAYLTPKNSHAFPERSRALIKLSTSIINHTRLIDAIRKQDLRTVKTIACMLSESEINAQDDFGIPPLICATQSGDTAMVEALLENQGIDVNVKNRTSGDTALIESIKLNQNNNMEQILISAKADIHLKNHKGESAYSLMQARNPNPKPVCLSTSNQSDSTLISIEGLSKDFLLTSLYLRACFPADEFYRMIGNPLPLDLLQQARLLLTKKQSGNPYFYYHYDYIDLGKGQKPLKINLTGTSIDPKNYDREYGKGAVAGVIQTLRGMIPTHLGVKAKT